MAQVMLEKADYGDVVLRGDIVNIFEDSHEFSREELANFDIKRVPNFTRDEFMALLPDREYKHAFYHTSQKDRWTLEDPEVKHVWRELPNGNWKEIPNKRKGRWNAGKITAIQWTALEQQTGTIAQRAAIIGMIQLKDAQYPENMVEVADLN